MATAAGAYNKSISELDTLITSLESHLGVSSSTPAPLPSHPTPSSSSTPSSTTSSSTSSTSTTPSSTATPSTSSTSTPTPSTSTPAAKSQPQSKKSTGPAAKKAPTPYDQFYKSHLQVGKLTSVAKHPSADKLYLCSVQISATETRQLVTGLVTHYPVSALQDRYVVVITNLPPKKLVGIESKAMLLAGDDGGGEAVVVKVLDPPKGVEIGDWVWLEGDEEQEIRLTYLTAWGRCPIQISALSYFGR
eukprot:TRINITY_DN2321_c0_g1_i2.p1 TRINITY_DN2321_c0_g1~~TRINITY_DN2321_c0_g1_i2.p1  ORF type:complete len:247 (-),score=84.97 TRINITY_DN2321_c0_g1_i2:43-783(-)